VNPYVELAGLEHIALEESYVLDVTAKPGELVVTLDIALAPDHEKYTSPPPDEVECYKRGTLKFTGVRLLGWHYEGIRPSIDATGEADYGNVDVFHWTADHYQLEGSFGTLDLTASKVAITFDDDPIASRQ